MKSEGTKKAVAYVLCTFRKFSRKAFPLDVAIDFDEKIEYKVGLKNFALQQRNLFPILDCHAFMHGCGDFSDEHPYTPPRWDLEAQEVS
jgi:hypothetical protein